MFVYNSLIFKKMNKSESGKKLTVAVKRLPHNAGLPLPAYETNDSAGADLRVCGGPYTVLPGERMLIPTGIAVALPAGFEAQLRPRSGLALRHGVTLLNSPGTIDADYRGEVGVIVINHGGEPVNFMHGDRIAQLVISPVVQAVFESADELQNTVRGSGGFGSTGKS